MCSDGRRAIGSAVRASCAAPASACAVRVDVISASIAVSASSVGARARSAADILLCAIAQASLRGAATVLVCGSDRSNAALPACAFASSASIRARSAAESCAIGGRVPFGDRTFDGARRERGRVDADASTDQHGKDHDSTPHRDRPIGERLRHQHACNMRGLRYWQPSRAPVAQLDRASDYESEGRTFEIVPGAPILPVTDFDHSRRGSRGRRPGIAFDPDTLCLCRKDRSTLRVHRPGDETCVGRRCSSGWP